MVEVVLGALRRNGTLYSILGIDDERAQVETIRKAYRRLILEIHPDKCHHKDAAEAFAAVQSAWEILRSDPSRRKYDSRKNARKDHPPPQPPSRAEMERSRRVQLRTDLMGVEKWEEARVAMEEEWEHSMDAHMERIRMARRRIVEDEWLKREAEEEAAWMWFEEREEVEVFHEESKKARVS